MRTRALSSLASSARQSSKAALSRPTCRCLATPSTSRGLFVQARMTTRPFSSTRAVLQTPPPSDSTVPIKHLTASEYDRLSEDDMETMHERLEELCEEYLTGAEVEYSSGVMTLSTPRGTYVINKQPPNQQIWISSPISGPARFGYSPDGVWVHHRLAGVTLGGILDKELREIAGETEWEGTGLR